MGCTPNMECTPNMGFTPNMRFNYGVQYECHKPRGIKNNKIGWVEIFFAAELLTFWLIRHSFLENNISICSYSFLITNNKALLWICFHSKGKTLQ